MPVRARLALMLAATFVLVAALSIVLFAGRQRPAGGAGFDGALRPPGIPPIDFALRDQDGKVATLAPVPRAGR